MTPCLHSKGTKPLKKGVKSYTEDKIPIEKEGKTEESCFP